MLTKVRTATLSGIEGYPVTVETDLHSGLPGFHIVGLADTTIKEASKRIKPAIQNCGGTFPGEKVTVNLVPAGRPKEGSHFDLPIALGIMMLGSDVIELEDTAFIGEVSLDGTINGVRGALPLAICLRQAGIKNLVLPLENAAEVSILEDINLLPVEHLRDAAEYVLGIRKLPLYIRKEIEAEHAKEALRSTLLVWELGPVVIRLLCLAEDIIQRCLGVEKAVHTLNVALVSKLKLVFQIVESVVHRRSGQHQDLGLHAGLDDFIH